MSNSTERALKVSRRARRSGRLGRRYEAIALAWLRLKGYRLLARRFGGKGGEIDLIMLRGSTVAFVEIKARARIEDAAAAITAEKRRLVEARMRQWLSRNPWGDGADPARRRRLPGALAAAPSCARRLHPSPLTRDVTLAVSAALGR